MVLKRILVISITGVIGIIICFAAYIAYSFSSIYDTRSEENLGRAEISIPNLNTAVHVRQENWGITGDYQEILISASRKNNRDDYNPQTDYRYTGLGSIFYSTQGDTLSLFLYERKSPIPTQWSSPVTIKQVVVDKAGEWHRLIERINAGIYELDVRRP